MKVAIPIDSQQGLGGGFTFARNLTKGLQKIGVEVVQDPLQADVALIAGVTMITKETFRAIRDAGVKTIVRLDNVPRNSRNRNTGTSRLRGFSQQANEVIFQGEWAKFYLSDFVGREGKIVHNGLDLDVYTPQGDKWFLDWENRDLYLYSRFNRDETKNWEVAWYEYQLIQRENKNAKLIIIGKFSPEIVEYDFDFFRGENFEYLGIVEDPMRMAKLLRSVKYLIAPYFNDAFSNTYLEALCTGVELYKPNMSGGTPEMLQLFKEKGREYFSLERMANDYKKVFEEVLSKGGEV